MTDMMTPAASNDVINSNADRTGMGDAMRSNSMLDSTELGMQHPLKVWDPMRDSSYMGDANSAEQMRMNGGGSMDPCYDNMQKNK